MLARSVPGSRRRRHSTNAARISSSERRCGIALSHAMMAERYALPTTALLAVFYGNLVVGWRSLRPSRRRTAWMLTGVAAAAWVLAGAPRQLHALANDRSTFSNQSRVITDLASIGKTNSSALPSGSEIVYFDVSSFVMVGPSVTLIRRSHLTFMFPS